jgi:riboflavin kinase/FMN adenylyltransferase
MTVHQELAKISPPRDTVLTIGTFDGVHLGHQQLLQRLKALADSSGLLAAVLTFRNHPRLVLNSELELSYITTLEDRLDLLRGQGIDLVISVDFTRDLSLLGAREFVGLLCGHLKMKSLVVGPDFALGHGREGDISTLTHLGEEMGFRVQAIEPTMMMGDVIKSSKTRGLIAQGDVETASRMLGRWYALSGLVVEGDRRGRLLGFPTANLSLDPSVVIPADGIYATWAVVDGRRYQGATCIGLRPTFGVNGRTVETFILDFQGDIYGKRITLEFANRLREEQAFPNVEALVEQMKIDVEQTRDALSASG